jgi:hypothetical protein
MTAAKVNLKEGKKMPLVRIWSSDNYFFSSLLGYIVCSSYRYSTRYSHLLREIGFGIFGALTVYFFVDS